MGGDSKTAIVTGSSRSVGRATALALAERGYAVAINYSTSHREAEAVVQEIQVLGGRAISVQADVSDNDSCKHLVDCTVERLGRLDALINNAGTTSFIPHNALDQITDEDWDRIMGVNLKGPFQMVRAALPALTENGGGCVVNVASIAGLSATGSSIPYCASKAALLNMTVALARVCAPEVRVNAVAPGFIEGAWLKQGLGNAYDMVKKQCEERSPLHKVCQPEDVSDAIMALVEGSQLVTGQTVVVDGGMLIGSTP
ncbi:MAG: SDR family oxidoreductase [Candidatus Hydrogenedentes bacterium]|nr:SDR family oxidoreductase [Candidatus Hydrogenedentota bacterium]